MSTLKTIIRGVGRPGYDAYEIAVQQGFEGTRSEWLESLVGEPGQEGAPGPNIIDSSTSTPFDGVIVGDGESPYSIPLEDLVTQDELIESLASNFGGIADTIYVGGRLTSVIYGDGSVKTHTYNGLGQKTVTVHTLANGAVVTRTRTYNADGTLSRDV